MAILSLLFSFLGRKVGDIVLAVFGWSVTSLFGRLPRKQQLAVSAALALSIAWPVFVVGLAFPAVAGWAISFLPLESWFGPTPLRITWGVLAVATPIFVGLLVHWAAPSTRGSIVRTMIAGYPLALGLFVSFIITAVSVPILKIVAFGRGWTDTHVYVQPRVGAYRRVVRDLAEACARAGMVPEMGEPAATMTLAFRALRFFAKAAVLPILSEEVLSIRADGVELVVYPSDLLLRGKPVIVARVRAMMGRTELDSDAYLVASAGAQKIQDELGRLRDVVRDHEKKGHTLGEMASKRLCAIWRELTEADLPYEEWVMLEAIARRIERRIVHDRTGESMLLDGVEDGLARVARRANAEPITSPGAWSARPT